MSGVLRVGGHGISFSVRLPASFPADHARLPHGFSVQPASGEVDFELELVERAGRWIVRDSERDWALAEDGLGAMKFAGDFALHRAALSGRSCTFVHAATATIGGVGVMLPGRSGAGKSTLVEALVRAHGVKYMSDEYALVQDDGRVLAFPRPIVVSSPNSSAERRQPFSAEIEGGPVDVKLILFTSFNGPVAGPPEPLRLGRGLGFAALLEHVVSLRGAPASSLTRVHRLVARAQVVRVDRGEAEEFAQWLVAFSSTLAN